MKSLIVSILITASLCSAHAEIIPTPTQYLWVEHVNPTDSNLQRTLASHGIILLDTNHHLLYVRSEIKTESNTYDWMTIGVVFALDKGYGFSSGPFQGNLFLVPATHGMIYWFKITIDTGLDLVPISIYNPNYLMPN